MFNGTLTFRAFTAGTVLALPLALLPPHAVPPAHSAVAGQRVRDVQGAGHESPLTGRTVTGVPGVVTAVTGNGFWMQDPRPDGREATSEGVFVFTRTRPAAVAGDSVRVDGKVSEFRPGGASSANLSRTEIDATRTTVAGHGAPLPAPVTLGPKGRRAPGAIKGATDTFDPRRDALDFYEALEGMRVRVQDAVAVGPSGDGEIPVLPAGGEGAGLRTKRGGLVLREGDANPERVILDDALAALPAMNVGDRLPGPTDGVLDYGYGDFTFLPTATPQARSGGLARERTRPARPGELSVATASMDGLSPDTPPARVAALAADIVDGLQSPDLVTVSGIQDNSGTKDDGVVVADQTMAELITAISAAGGPAYDWRAVSPRDNADGGDSGGNNRVGFLFRTDRGLAFVDRPALGADPEPAAAGTGPDLAATATRVLAEKGRARLTLSPGRISPKDTAWSGTRKPLAAEVTWRGRRLIVVANHWTPQLGDDQPLFGRRQPPTRPSEWRREAQARVVARFVTSARAADKNAGVIVAGNLNERDFAAPPKVLTGDAGLTDLPAAVPQNERYTAIVGGNAQALDHIMLSPALKRGKHEFDIVHRASEFADREGDRDPTIVRLQLPPAK
ncbi:endonuclease/exonuclease/phosphatase family protein [Spirillospora sp. NPDC048911]|uniref:endonuclease/exonuclease/phosphatase family protein n=1 Tax=Spirillospora sp. NPDC048911 TaxID=3364527 RepID=UPI00371F3E93